MGGNGEHLISLHGSLVAKSTRRERKCGILRMNSWLMSRRGDRDLMLLRSLLCSYTVGKNSCIMLYLQTNISRSQSELHQVCSKLILSWYLHKVLFSYTSRSEIVMAKILQKLAKYSPSNCPMRRSKPATRGIIKFYYST